MSGLNYIIAVSVYIIAGFKTAEAHSTAYQKDKWFLLWLVTMFWPVYVLWACVGLFIEFVTWVHNKLFPKA